MKIPLRISALIAFAAVVVSAWSAVPPPSLRQNFATTNTSTELTNIIQSIGTGTAATNVVLGPGGQITKAASSTSAVIMAGAIGNTNLALQSVDAGNIVNNSLTSNQIAVAGIHFVDLDPAIQVMWLSNDITLSNNLYAAAGAWTGVNQFRVLQRFDSITITNGLTNSSLTASAAMVSDANKKVVSLANGGANTFLQGTTPPTYTSIPDAALSANVVLANSANSLIGANIFTGVNSFRALQRMDSLVVTNGFTNSSLTASTAILSDANKKVVSLANGGANTFLQGTTPPTYTSIPDAALSSNVALEDVVNTFKVLQRVDSMVITNGFTNSALTASTALVSDANKKVVSLANGGANVLLHGTTPPAYTAVVEADLGLTDVTTANASTSAHGLLKKLDNNAAHFMNGAGDWATPGGGGGSAFPLDADADFNHFGGTNITFLTGTNGISISFDSGPAASAFSASNANGVIFNLDTNGNAVFVGGIKSAGQTNTALSANTILFADGNKAESSLANGGANTFLQGTSPPSYTSIPDAALSANVPLLNAANAWSGVNQLKVLTRADSLVVTNGFTNSSLTASTAILSDANKKVVSLANGGANTFLQGTTPPTYTSIADAALSANVMLADAANPVTGVNQFRVLQRMDSLVVTNGFTNSSLTASTALLSDANKKVVSLANGGANTFLQGTAPPTYTSIPDAALSANVMLDNAANPITGVNQFRVLQRMDSLVVTNGFTNSSLTANSIMASDANNKAVSIANGGANTVLHGTAPPQYLAVTEGDQQLSDVLTLNASTSAHGYLLKLDNNSAHFMNGAGAWATPPGGGTGILGATNPVFWVEDASLGYYKRTNGVELAKWGPSGFAIETNITFGGGGNDTVQRNNQGLVNGFMPVINAWDYGLSTNSDNTTAFQNALNAGTNSGQVVLFPASPTGAWQVNGTLQVYRQRVIGEAGTQSGISGAGTVLDHGNNDGGVININGVGSEVGWIGVRGNSTTHGYGFTATNIVSGNSAQSFSIHDCSAQTLNRGYFFTSAWVADFRNNCSANTIRGITLSNACNGWNISGGHFTGPANSYGIYFEGDNNYGNLIAGSVFEGLTNAAFGTGLNNKTTFAGCYFETDTNAVVWNGGQSLTIRDCQFITGSGNTTTNIILVGCRFPAIRDNHFIDTQAMWHIDSTTTGADIWHNDPDANAVALAKNVNAASTFTYHGGTNMVVSGGSYYGLSALTNAAGYALAGLNDVTNTANSYSNGVWTVAKNFTNETTLRFYQTNVDQNILTPSTATNTMPLYGGFWRLVISTPSAITNLTGVTAGVYAYATCVFSNSLATTLTNRMLINAIASGYDATNSVAALGLNGFVVGAGKQVRLLVDAEGINQTNWMLIRQ